MQPQVIHRGSESLSLSDDIDTSMLQVKTAIVKAITMPQCDQILTHRGVYLEDVGRLKYYKIEECGSLERDFVQSFTTPTRNDRWHDHFAQMLNGVQFLDLILNTCRCTR
ncbi:unnamed protein product [Taenia asiatica]|uniref:Ubiquitin-like domain-containing protein n=1 Tax=Taenia asiatica TaxID=60517 RepID=A0A0R3W9L6_TAEAS|nr:unnamed protein product [Taenia asiatica]